MAIYKGLNVRDDIEDHIFNETLRLFNEAASKGLTDSKWSDDVPDEFINQIRTNNRIWSAFRVHRMQNDIAAQLLDSDGQLKPFDKWLKDIKGMTNHYVGPWLRTEYNTAVLRAHQAADWKHFEAEQDVFPNLRWMPTTSPQQDPLHRQYWESKLTLPINHPFWSEHRPGDRWNCKCTLEQTDAAANDTVIKDFYPVPQQQGLDNNPGDDGKLFSDSHPYITKAYAGAKKAVEMKIKSSSVLRSTTREMVDLILDNVRSKRLINASTDLGAIDKPIASFLRKKGIRPETNRLVVSDVGMQHALRASKAAKGIGMPESDLVDALCNLDKCDVYFDSDKDNVWYVWHTPKQSYKLVFDFNEKIKIDRVKLKVNQLTTAGKVQASDLGMQNLTKIR